MLANPHNVGWGGTSPEIMGVRERFGKRGVTGLVGVRVYQMFEYESAG